MSGVKITMLRKWLLLPVATVVVVAFAVAWLLLSGRVGYLTLDRRLKVEINGVPVDGEILSNRTTAIVTRRDAGNKHSYQLFFEGDMDSTGDTAPWSIATIGWHRILRYY